MISCYSIQVGRTCKRHRSHLSYTKTGLFEDKQQRPRVAVMVAVSLYINGGLLFSFLVYFYMTSLVDARKLYRKLSAVKFPGESQRNKHAELDGSRGVSYATDRYIWRSHPCLFLEAQNTSTLFGPWEVRGKTPYLYLENEVESGYSSVHHPALGIRSAVPLGGISTGSIELRLDGSFHEWTIRNQHPAGAAKIQNFDDAMLGIFTRMTDDEIASNDVKQTISQSKFRHKISQSAFAIRTHPPPDIPGVEKIALDGIPSYPLTTLKPMHKDLAVDVSLRAYSTLKYGDMKSSATPAIAFNLQIKSFVSVPVDVSVMLNMPLGMEKNTKRTYVVQSDNSKTWSRSTFSDLECFRLCSDTNECQSWTFFNENNTCVMYTGCNLNQYEATASSGLKGFWEVNKADDILSCISLNQPGNGMSEATSGNLSICGPTSEVAFGAADSVSDLWGEFSKSGKFGKFSVDRSSSPQYTVHGAASLSFTVGPYSNYSANIILSWYYPHRDFIGKTHGNYYSNLFRDSLDVGSSMYKRLQSTTNNIEYLRNLMQNASLPDFYKEVTLMNSFSHIRSAMWFKDGTWRQWESFDDTDIDSVHNDGERHIPYIMYFPDSTRNKMYGWARSQNSNGMIAEELRVAPRGDGSVIDVPGGRVNSDVSSMFVVYLLEMYRWAADKVLLAELWPVARKAVQWHMQVADKYGVPLHLENSYDYQRLNNYDMASYATAFHLLAMRAGEELALVVGDKAFAAACRKAYTRGVEAMDKYQWNSTAQYYNAYTNLSDGSTDNEVAVEVDQYHFGVNHKYGDDDEKQIIPDTPGAIMTDTFYAQVLAFTVGLGPLVNTSRLRLHLNAELEKNDSPYGMLVMTGRYPYPGHPRDNTVWQMGNPNWATLNAHLGGDLDLSYKVANKTLDRWRSELNDLWNVPGGIGGIGYGAEGLPYITSHYGFFMSSWHLLFAVSGQLCNLPEGTLTFNPRISEKTYSFPVMLPGKLGKLQAVYANNKIVYIFSIKFADGPLILSKLSVNGSAYPGTVKFGSEGGKVSWSPDLL